MSSNELEQMLELEQTPFAPDAIPVAIGAVETPGRGFLPLSPWPAMPPEIAKAIISIMKEIQPIQKKGYNTDQKYKYLAFGDLLAEIQPMMAANGLIVLQFERAIRPTPEGFVEIEYDFALFHESGVTWAERMKITGTSRLKFKSGATDDKAYPKCHSMARKLYLMALFQIPSADLVDADDDDDKRSGGNGASAHGAHPLNQIGNQPELSPAKRWAAAAQRAVGACATMEDLKAWRLKSVTTMDKLETEDKDASDALWLVITDKQVELAEKPVPARKGDEVPF